MSFNQIRGTLGVFSARPHRRVHGAPLNEHRENAVFDLPVVQFVYTEPATVVSRIC